MDEYISKHEAYLLLKDLEAAYIYPPVKDAYSKAALRIDQLRPADVQPVRHGHWIEEVREIGGTFRLYQTYIHCSECGKEHYSGTLPKPNFCDECGADMRGDTQ